MAKAHASIDLQADPGRVWQLIGGFDSLPDWLPAIPESTLSEGGRVRTLKSVDGAIIVERLLEFSEADRSYSYTIVQGPAPVSDYHATLRVRSGNDSQGACVEWFGTFNPQGISEGEASELFNGIYAGGLAALKQTLEG